MLSILESPFSFLCSMNMCDNCQAPYDTSAITAATPQHRMLPACMSTQKLLISLKETFYAGLHTMSLSFGYSLHYFSLEQNLRLCLTTRSIYCFLLNFHTHYVFFAIVVFSFWSCLMLNSSMNATCCDSFVKNKKHKRLATCRLWI